MPAISFMVNGQTGNGRSVIINPQRTVNLFPELMPDGKTISLVGVPGMSLFSTVSAGASDYIRGSHVMNGVLYVVSGNSLYTVNSSGTATLVHTLATSTGLVYMSDNNPAPVGGDQLMIVDGTYGYIYNITTTTWTQLSNATHGFPSNGATSVTMVDGYFIVSEKTGGGRFWVSDALDGLTWNSLNVAGSLSISNTLQRVVSFNNQLWLFGSAAIEVWYNSGYGYPPFSPVSGMTLMIGTVAHQTIVDANTQLIWLGRSNKGAIQVLTTSGGAPAVISTPEIEYTISNMTSVTDAYAFYLNHEGHAFYVLTFPTGNATFVFDFRTQMWHERSSWTATTGMTPNYWYVNNSIYFNNAIYVGDSAAGKLYLLSSANYTDNGNPIVAFRQTQAISSNREFIFHSSFELLMETGVGLDGYGSTEGGASAITYGGGTDPQVMIQWSDDGGKTWGNEHWLSYGKMGEFRSRVLLRRLGKSRNRVYRYMISDPVKRVVTDAVLHYQKVAA